ncbi:Fcf2-domain-containing protein [Lepidopterella palustris CBS 459.81]|uniref:Fcf2-domain-containing protein n=1 Tax=Lepidopterella palustris CBS 459.81 TaxID=1314670 RepID=A0A8E2JEC5_9PEZI|nr:Fcf2-domain-containing protein [Lepidopterella palustris CBS 459.81]
MDTVTNQAHSQDLDKQIPLDSNEELSEELSDEQIQNLLKQAEIRMRAKQAAHQLQDMSPADLRLPKLDSRTRANPYICTEKGVSRINPSRLFDNRDRTLANEARKVVDKSIVKKSPAEGKPSLSNWFNLPRTDLTPELRADLQLLKMRNVINPKIFYKKESLKPTVPEFSHVGVIIEGPTEYHSGRLHNKERKKSFVEELLTAEAATGRFKKKYNEIQISKMSGKKAYYKGIKARRKGRAEKG